MTTIVCNREVMAGDTLLVAATKAHGIKVFKCRGACVGVAGTFVHCMEFVDWYKKGAKGEPPEMEEVDALVLTKDGRILCFDHHHSFFEVTDDFAAIGSGGAAALAAMYMGASPEQAIKVAGKVDPNTGGKPTIRRRGKKHAKETT